jgi:dienelactone hydrolase
MARLLLPLALALALVGCARDAPEKNVPVEDELASRFAYRAAGGLEEGTSRVSNGIGAFAATYGAPGGGEVTGYVVRELEPADDDVAGIVFAHGAGGGADDFLNEARELARRGAVVLATDSPFVRSEDERIREGTAELQETYDTMVRWVKELRLGLDLLVEEYGVDPRRLALVGYSMGAQPATLAAALDPRVRALVVMAGQAYPSGLPDDLLARRLFSAIDTVRFVDNLAPTKLLIQGAEFDATVPRHELEVLAEEASEPVELRWYDADHELGQQAARERVEWLGDVLGLR